MKHFISCILLFIFLSPHVDAQNFILKGTLKGFEDGTIIIINPFLENMDIDRDDETKILINNGEFEFARQLNKPTKFSVRVRPTDPDKLDEYEDLTFWAENSIMNLNGTKDSFFYSRISGSEIQDHYFEYIQSISETHDLIKQITDSVKSVPNLSEDLKSEMRIRFYTALKRIEKQRFDFIYNHPDYYCTAPELVFYITFFPEKLDKNAVYKFYYQMPLLLQSNIFGTQLKSFVGRHREKIPELKINDYPYNFILKDTAGNEVSFSAIKSKVVLLDFWGAGCAPYRKENRNFVALYDLYKDKGLEIVSVSTDQSKKMLIKAMRDDHFTWISLWDETKEIYRDLYQIKALPTSYLFVDGRIKAINLRGKELRDKIAGLLGEANY